MRIAAPCLASLQSAVRRVGAPALLLAVVAALPGRARAQSGDGYLFHAPIARLTLQGGFAHANANSDIFDFSTENLTLNKSDFSGFTGDAELGFALGSRFDASFEVGVARSSKRSEFRHFTDNNDLPIEQTTAFTRVPLMANLRFYLTPTGRSIGRLAWIPNKVTPYIGAGVGTMYYQFRQSGDFVDFQTLAVFPNTFESSAWAPAAQALAGAEFTISPRLAFTADARYITAKGDIVRSFTGFNKIDLSGVSGMVGLTVRM